MLDSRRPPEVILWSRAPALAGGSDLGEDPVAELRPSLAALAAREPGDPHPFVMGPDGYQRFWQIISECMQADIVRKALR